MLQVAKANNYIERRVRIRKSFTLRENQTCSRGLLPRFPQGDIRDVYSMKLANTSGPQPLELSKNVSAATTDVEATCFA
jgi:hypothetical protein